MRRIMGLHLICAHKADDLVPPTLIISTCIESLLPQELLALTRHPAASWAIKAIIAGPTTPPRSRRSLPPCDGSTVRERHQRLHQRLSGRALLGGGGPIFRSMLGIPGCAWAKMTGD